MVVIYQKKEIHLLQINYLNILIQKTYYDTLVHGYFWSWQEFNCKIHIQKVKKKLKI